MNESDLNENRSMEALSLKMAKTVELKEITWDLHVICYMYPSITPFLCPKQKLGRFKHTYFFYGCLILWQI